MFLIVKYDRESGVVDSQYTLNYMARDNIISDGESTFTVNNTEIRIRYTMSAIRTNGMAWELNFSASATLTYTSNYIDSTKFSLALAPKE